MSDDARNLLSDRCMDPASTGYVILSETHINLTKMLRDHLRAGWALQGGATPFGERGQIRFYQTMFHPDFYEFD